MCEIKNLVRPRENENYLSYRDYSRLEHVCLNRVLLMIELDEIKKRITKFNKLYTKERNTVKRNKYYRRFNSLCSKRDTVISKINEVSRIINEVYNT